MPFTPADYLWIALALVISLIAAPLVRHVARRIGAVAAPKADRWHQKPTALLGGVGIYAAVVCVYLVGLPHSSQTLTVVVTSTLLWALGLLDDFWGLKPYQKLIGQVMTAAIAVSAGLMLRWTPWDPVNMGVTIFWLVGITNAVNLLDNMDGLAAGIGAIASVFLAICFLQSGQAPEALLLLVLAAALIGFLFYNTHPASIFMGDCGSMFIGFFLASMALLANSGGRSRTFLPVLAVPVLVLLIPIFDITVVTVLRKLAGRPISQGGRDHTSHRLVALGMSEKRAVWLLYALANASGILAISVHNLQVDLALAAIAGFTIGLTLLGVHLAGVKVYSQDELEAARHKPLVSFLFELSHRRRIFEVLLDVVLIILAYYLANVMIFGPIQSAQQWQQVAAALPVLVFVKMAAFLALGVYRGLWRYVSIDSLVVYAKAVLAGSAASALVFLAVYRFQGFSRAVFVLDALLLLVLLGGSRVAFRVFRSMLPAPSSTAPGRRVLIYGAGDAGELLLRELRNNHDWNYQPVGFLDDDPLKKGKLIHGLRVLGGNGAFTRICQEQQVSEVLISTAKISEERTREILRECQRARVSLRRMHIRIEPLLVGGYDGLAHSESA